MERIIPRLNRLKKSPVARAALASTLTAMVATGCLPEATPFRGPGTGLRVGLAGDSQLYQAENNSADLNVVDTVFTDELVAAGYDVSTTLDIGANTSDLIPGNPH